MRTALSPWVFALLLAVSGCAPLRRAARLRQLQQELVFADAERGTPEESSVVPEAAPAPGAPPPVPTPAATQAPTPQVDGNIQAPALPFKECPVDFKKFPRDMQYCPEHGTRLREPLVS